MIKSVVRFYKNAQRKPGGSSLFDTAFDEPQIYYSFWIVASPWEATDSGIASILPLTSDSSSLQNMSKHLVSWSGGEEAAYLLALEYLKTHESLSQLGSFEQRDQ